jgi:hypothetical protein
MDVNVERTRLAEPEAQEQSYGDLKGREVGGKVEVVFCGGEKEEGLSAGMDGHRSWDSRGLVPRIGSV